MDLFFWLQMLVMVVLLLLSGFFSSSETALFSLKQHDRQTLAATHPKQANTIEMLLVQPRRLIVTILIGNESVNVTASTLSASMLVSAFDGGAYLNMFVMVPLLLLIGEITPKTLAIKHNRAFSLFLAPKLEKFAHSISPLRNLVRFIADWFITLIIGRERSEGNLITEDMMRTLAADALIKGALDSTEAEMIHQIFDFGSITAEDVMTPRSDISTLPLTASLPDTLGEFQSQRHTKIPVYGNDSDDIVGLLFVRDVLGLDLSDTQTMLDDFQSLLRPVFFVPETKAGSALFKDFHEKRITIAMVVDEYGGVVGLVTMEDLLETIFGDIYSPSDKDSFTSQEISTGHHLIDGTMKIEQFNDEFNAKLDSSLADTIGGLIFHTLGELPTINAHVKLGKIKLTVKSMDEKRIESVEVRLKKSRPKLKAS